MPKRTKKQRQALDFKEIQLIQQTKDFSSNNSSSIIHPNQEQFQTSQTHLTVGANSLKPTIVKVRPSKVIVFEEDQQQKEEQKEYDSELSSHVAPRIDELSNQEDQSNEKKQTVATNNESGRSVLSKNIQETEERKQETEHYQYDEKSESNSDQQNDNSAENEQGEIGHKNKKVLQVEKQFFASTLEDLVFAPIPPNCTVTCAVSFNHQVLSMTRKYNLYLVKEKKYLFSAVKQRLKLTSEFQLKRIDTKEDNILGYLKSNFTGLQYVINKVHKNEQNRVSEQCWIGYDLNLLGLTPQRNITILKNINAKLEKLPFFSQIKNYYENGLTSKFQKFISKKAVENKNGQYELDFHGKVSNPSSKNFILTDTKERQCILFGRRRNNTFILQISHPFSILEGFAIAVSSLDHKLCVR